MRGSSWQGCWPVNSVLIIVALCTTLVSTHTERSKLDAGRDSVNCRAQSACRIRISATNALLGRQLLRQSCMIGSLTTRLFVRLEFNITPWLLSLEEEPWMTGITRFKIINFLFSAVFPSNSAWPISTSKGRLSLETLRHDRQKYRNCLIKSMCSMKHFRAVYQLHVDLFFNFLMKLLFVYGRYQ